MKCSLSWLLSSVALPVFCLGGAASSLANDACSTAGTVQTCTGDQSGGVSVTNPVTDLVVNNVTTKITPAGLAIYQTANSASVTVHIAGYNTIAGFPTSTTTYGISTSGTNANGISSISTGGTSTVTSRANIQASGLTANGIYSQSVTGQSTIDTVGNVETNGATAHGLFSLGASSSVTSIGQISALGVTSDGISHNRRAVPAASVPMV